MRTLKNFLQYSVKYKAIVYQLGFIGAFLQAKVNNRLFVKLDSRYAEYFQYIQVTLEYPWDYWNLCMELLTLESYLLMS